MTELPGASVVDRDELIDRVRRAWAEVLDVADAAAVPLDANFLEVGGNSLLLIMLWESLNGMTGGTLKVSQLFQHGSVRAQAELLARTDGREGLVGLGAHERGQLLGRARRDASPGSSASAGDQR